MKVLRVGIIGAGQAGERHAGGFAATKTAKLVGIADLQEARAQKLASQFEAKPFTDWQKMLEEDLDILVVSLPHNMHLEPAKEAAKRGINVLMEKPIATNLTDAKQIIEVCQQAGVKLSISFVHRFREELLVAKQWLGEGWLGQPQTLRETMNGQRGTHLPDWVNQADIAGGGVLMYSAIHGLDRLRWLTGSEVIKINAETTYSLANTEVESGVSALLSFANGASATLSANAPSYRAQPAHWETEIYGTKGMLRLRTRHWIEFSNDALSKHIDTQNYSLEGGPHYNFTRQAQDFISAIQEDRNPLVTAEDGLKSLELALAIYQSAKTGQSVTLESEDI